MVSPSGGQLVRYHRTELCIGDLCPLLNIFNYLMFLIQWFCLTFYCRIYSATFNNSGVYISSSYSSLFRFIVFRHVSSLRLAGHVARMEEGRSAFKIVTGKPAGKRLFRRPRRRWEGNIRMDLEEIGINARNWVDSALDRNYCRTLVNAALNLRVP